MGAINKSCGVRIALIFDSLLHRLFDLDHLSISLPAEKKSEIDDEKKKKTAARLATEKLQFY